MTFFIQDAFDGHASTIEILFAERRRHRIVLLVLCYGIVSLAGIAAAGYAADAQGWPWGIAVGLLIVLGASAVMLGQTLRGVETKIRKSLDTLASMRVMALQAQVPLAEQQRLQAAFRALREKETQSFFGRRRTLL